MKIATKHLIAESGSTKTDWLVFDEKSQCSFSCGGMNPLTMDRTYIESEIWLTLQKNVNLEEIHTLNFYGAGCKNEAGKNKMTSILQSILPERIQLEILSDIHACARASCQNEQGIVAILGTGSHAAISDGHIILHDLPSLGYLLGDEGSGSYFGKKIISLYVLEQLAEELTSLFENKFATSKETIISTVYSSVAVSKKLGEYGKFVIEHRNHIQMEQIIQEGLSLFIQKRISCYSDKKHLPVHTCGSVASILHKEFKEQLQLKGFTSGRVILRPIDNLIDYHLERNS